MQLPDDVLFQINARIELHNLAGEMVRRGDTSLAAILRSAVQAIDRRIALAEDALEWAHQQEPEPPRPEPAARRAKS